MDDLTSAKEALALAHMEAIESVPRREQTAKMIVNHQHWIWCWNVPLQPPVMEETISYIQEQIRRVKQGGQWEIRGTGLDY